MTPKRERYWQAFKTVVYLVGYSLCCLWLVNYNTVYMNHFISWQSHDLASGIRILLVLIWAGWTIGVAGIILDGMKYFMGDPDE